MDLTVIGMISGTSYDAVDAAVADLSLSGDEIVCRPRGLHSEDVPDKLRARIAASPLVGRAALEARVLRTYSPFHVPAKEKLPPVVV